MAQIPKRQLLSEFLRHLDQATRARLRDDEGPPGSWVDSLQISVDELFAVLDHTLTNVLGRKFGYQADIRLQNLVDLVSDVELRDDPRAVRLATRCLAECPPEIKGKKTADWLHKLLTQCIIRSATPPSEAARADLIKAEARGDLIWSVRLLSATCLFPHEAESLRRRIRQTNFKSEKTMGYIQDWTLRFAADSSFLETWGQLFKRANYDQRRRLMERAVTSEGADDVLRGLAWIRTRKVLGPTAGYAAFAAAHKVPASGLFLAWYAIHGPGEAQMEVLAALENHQGPHIEEAVQLLARESLVPEVQARAAERLTQGVTGPRPKDPLSLAVSRILNDASDPGGLDFGERQLIGYAWREAFDRPGAAPLQEAQRRRLVALAHGLIDTLEGDSPPADPTTWYEYSTRIFSRGPWAGRTDTRDLFIRAWRQTARESLHSDTLGRLWNAAEEGWLRLDERLADALELDHTRDTTDRWLRAKLRLPRTDVPFRSHVRSGQLGDAPPVGLQRHVLAQRPDNAARSALVTLYEVSNETQRRGLLLALEPPVDPGFVPVIEAIATQGAPQTAAAAVRALGRCGPWAVNGFLHGLRDQQKGLDDIIDEALEALKERHADAGDAGAGALALADTGGGELAIATDEAGDEDGDGPTDTAVTLRLAPDNPFDRMASPPPQRALLGAIALLGPRR